MQQKTLKAQIEVHGKGLHTGENVSVCLKPAPIGNGIRFKRMDIQVDVEIPASIHNVGNLVRGTTLIQNDIQVHTVEHLLAALYGLGIDNVDVEVQGSEIPILDGSAKTWVEEILSVGFELQNAEKEFIEITTPISCIQDDRSIIILPYNGFQITCTSTDNRNIHTQHLSLAIDGEHFAKEIANARTFTLYEDIEPLLKMGKIKGGSLDCAIVIKGDKLLSNEPLRYADEFVRHKILDIIGDLALLGKPLKGHVIAIKTGHALNAQLTKAILEQYEDEANGLPMVQDQAVYNIQDILSRLPHRYPFILVDRVVKIEGDRLQAIKNVTINEPFFQGHFPNNPVMPGVLQLEAMAQAAGILMGHQIGQSAQAKNVFFMSADKVKFRNVVQPGDQLVMDIHLLKIKNNKIGIAEAQCSVNDRVVSSAELMFMILNN